MERLGWGNYEGAEFVAEKPESGKDLLLRKIEGYCYLPEGELTEKETKKLAIMESREGALKEYNDWENKDETMRCEIKKKIEHALGKKKPAELAGYLEGLRKEYCREYVIAREKLPQANKNYKGRTILDADISEEAEDSFNKSMSGIENELIIHKILEQIGLSTRIASSKLDIINKIDLICSDGKVLLAVQVKGKFCKEPKNFNEKIWEEIISADSADKDKSKFFKGCEAFEKELKVTDQDMSVIKIWINIPTGYKTRDFGGYDHRLEEEVLRGLEKKLKIK